MPKQIIQTYLNRRLLFVHYQLNQKEEIIGIDRNPSIERLDALYEGANYNLVCFGHHHILHNYRSNSSAYFNPGALGTDSVITLRIGKRKGSYDDSSKCWCGVNHLLKQIMRCQRSSGLSGMIYNQLFNPFRKLVEGHYYKRE